LRCEKSVTPCPGYRDLSEALFRDQSEKVARKAHHVEQAQPIFRSKNPVHTFPKVQKCSKSRFDLNATPPSEYSPNISHSLSQTISELGANFFFAKYTFKEHPYSSDYHDWLTRSYLDEGPKDVLRAALEAVGMAGIANVYHTPSVASKSKQRYCEALIAMQQALNDPVQAIADTTFLAVILLGLFEVLQFWDRFWNFVMLTCVQTVNFETWDRYHYWEAHVNAATTLLELRGQEQFTRERGAQLYVQIRSQIVSLTIDFICLTQGPS
jgi:hypothetical protein